jgi:hypothetical protein
MWTKEWPWIFLNICISSLSPLKLARGKYWEGRRAAELSPLYVTVLFRDITHRLVALPQCQSITAVCTGIFLPYFRPLILQFPLSLLQLPFHFPPTGHWLDGCGSIPNWARLFSTPSRSGLGPTQSPSQWVPGGSFLGGKAVGAWSWQLTSI